MKILGTLAASAAFTAIVGYPAAAADVGTRLITESVQIEAGKPFWVAVELTMADGWHTYFVNPGDAGLPTDVEWTLPEEWIVDSLRWPVPATYGEPPEVTYGYEGRLLLLARITPPTFVADDSVRLDARVSWLACKEMCIPGSADVSLTLRVGRMGGEIDRSNEDGLAIHHALDELPTSFPGTASVAVGGANDRVILTLLDFRLPSADIGVDFYVMDQEVLDHSVAMSRRDTASGLELTFTRSPYSASPPERLRGMLVLTDGSSRRGYLVDANINSTQ